MERRRLLIALLAPVALASIVGGLWNAATLNIDFQWGAARVLLEGDDPFLVQAIGDPEGRIDVAALHAHLLYVLYLPLALLDQSDARVVWSLVNVVLGIISVLGLGRAFSLERNEVVILGLLLAASTPFRVALGNSQTPMLVLAGTVLLMNGSRARNTVIAGLSGVKWSFTPVLLVWLVIRRGWGRGALFLVVPAVGYLMFAGISGEFGPASLLRPIIGQSQEVSAALGYADLMSILRRLEASQALIIGAPLVATLAGAVWVARSFSSDVLSIAAVLAVSLATVNHLSYDLVLLAPALAAAIALRQHPAARGTLAICAYLFFNDWPTRAIGLVASVMPRIGGPVSAAGQLRAIADAVAEPVLATSVVTVAFHLLLMLVLISLLRRLDQVEVSASR